MATKTKKETTVVNDTPETVSNTVTTSLAADSVTTGETKQETVKTTKETTIGPCLTCLRFNHDAAVTDASDIL